MKELSLNILDVAENSVKAGAALTQILLTEEGNTLTLEIVDVAADGTPTVAGKYNGVEFVIDDADVTATFYSDAECTTALELPLPAGAVYAKLAATEDGDFTGESAAVAVNRAP